MRDRRLAVGLVIACIVHVVGGGATRFFRQHTALAPVPVPPLPAAELDLTLEAPESPTGRRVATEPAAAAPVAVVERVSIAGSHGIASAAVAEDSRAPDAVVAPTDQGGEGWSFDPVARRDIAIGKSGTIGPVASTVRMPRAPKSSYGLAGALDARDREVGMTRAGPLLTATEDAVREGRGPVEGKATFLVSVDHSGAVAVTLENADKEAEAWKGLIAAIQSKAEHGKPVRIPPNARGVLARIEINAELVWPSGQQVKDTDKPSGFYAQAPAVSSAGVRLPDVGVEIQGKICSARLSVTSLSIAGGCSVENIGMPSQRVVHGRIAEERRL